MKAVCKRGLIVTLMSLLLVVGFSLCAVAAEPGGDPYNFETNIELYPEMYDEDAAETVPYFSVDEAINEVVWVEVPIDTDQDGERDLIQVRISRPAGSGEDGFKVPVILEYSPYRNGRVADDVPFIENPYTEQYEVGENGVEDKSRFDYEDIETYELRARDWPWSDEAYYEDGVEIPASRGERDIADADSTSAVVSNSASFYNYMFTRGYAVIYASCVGNYWGNTENEGLNSCGDVEETLGGMAVINWLNGKSRAYTDKEATHEVIATDWCTGKVCMTGQSYVASLPMMVAATGIEGLECIIPRAGIVNWYDYFRGNGGVIAGQDAQGEDSAWLTWYCFGRYNSPDYSEDSGFGRLFAKNMEQMLEDADRITGDYNSFWDLRNSLATIEDWHAAVIFQQGFNDRNVGAEHMDQLYRALKKMDPDYPIKLVLHQMGHTTIFEQADGDVLELSHQWLDHYLYGIDNGVDRDRTNVLAVNTATGEWEDFREWPVEGSEMQRFYLSPDNELHSFAPWFYTEDPIYDQLEYRTLADYCEDPEDPYYVLKDWNSLSDRARENLLDDYEHWDSIETTQGREVQDDNWYDFQTLVAEGWEDNMLDYENIDFHSNARLAYVSEPLTEDLLLSGTPKVSLNITPNKGKGTLSVAIVEIGDRVRDFKAVNASVLPSEEVGTSRDWQLRNYEVSGEETPYKFVSRGSVDIQNPNPSGITYLEADEDTAFMPPFYWQTTEIIPGESYQYTFTLEPRHYTFSEGMRIAVIVYTTDYRHSPMPTDVTEVEVNLGRDTYIELPLVGDDVSLDGIDFDRYDDDRDDDRTHGDSFWEAIGEIDQTPTYPSFFDVSADAYYADAVAWALEKGVTTGTTATLFSPDRACTRAEAVTFLWRAAGSPEPVNPVNPFTDISMNAYYKAVLWAAEQGITLGTSATTFSPDKICTRAEIISYLWRFGGQPAVSGAVFSDVPAGIYYENAVAWAVQEGITMGTSATTFSPDQNCSRAEIVTYLYRYLGN